MKIKNNFRKEFMKIIAPVFLLLISPAFTFAQGNLPEMADVMRSDGKIYVVVTVMSIVFL
jgi:hypothetical protein